MPHGSAREVEYFVLLDEPPAADDSRRRRTTGFVVIALAVIALLVVAVGHGRTVSGAAVVPPPPRIGDCVSTSTAEQVWQKINNDGVPAIDTAPCTGSRAGEVVSVDDQRVYAQTDCGTPTLSYLGLPARPDVEPGPDTLFLPRSVVLSYTFGPSPLQIAAGQHWSACVALGVDHETFTSQALAESPRNAAIRGGAAFDPFASCSDAPLSNTSTSCGEPHRYEVIADGFNLGRSGTDSLATCRATVSRATGLADPTGGGRLRVELLAYVWDDGASTPRSASYQQARSGGGSVLCTVSPTSPDQKLTSTLVGLGGRDLPLV